MKYSNLPLLVAIFCIANILSSTTHVVQAQETVASATTETAESASESESASPADANANVEATKETEDTPSQGETKTGAPTPAPKQSGPFIDLFGENLLSLKMVDETHAQLETHLTNEALAGKKVIGVYFSADWCGPCRQFTPELVSFYEKMNKRRGKQDQFEIIWVSRCRDVKSFGQYFTHMKWLALPPEEAMGQRGQMLGDLMKVKGIPHFVLLDELGNVITYDARNKIPTDRAGIGFPWRNPLATLYVTLVPKSLRFMVKSRVDGIKGKVLGVLRKK